MKPKKVFISYAWDDQDFSEKILEFSNILRKNGIDANIDQYEENPDQGWPIWMENQIETADNVLIVCTKTYFEKFEQIKEGKGVFWEIKTIYQELYKLQGHNDKFIPVLFDDKDKKYILPALEPYTYYNVSNNIIKLINRINGVPNVVKPPVLISPLPEKQRKSLFISTPINIELWNKAQWSGVAFISSPTQLAMAFIFSGDETAAVKIFEEWQQIPNIDEYITFTFIEGEMEGLPTNGYTCLIAPNIEASAKRAEMFDKNVDIIVSINRFQRMYPKDKFKMFNLFKEFVLANKGAKFLIVPMTIKDKTKKCDINNYNLHFDRTVWTKNIFYKNSRDIKKEDLESCVVPKFNKNFPWNS